MAGTSLNERASLSPEERKRRYTQAYRDSVKPFIEKNFKDVKYDADGNFVSGTYIGNNDSATAGLTKQNFARATEGYASNNDGTYRYRATRELGIPDQIDQNPKYAAKDRMQYYLIDRANAFDVPARQLKTANDYWGQIYTVMSQDPVRGNQLAEQAKYLSTQYGNPLYNPYQTATVSPELKQLFGEESFSAEWVANNYGLLANLERTAAGNAKAPTKDSTDEQKLAYYYSQILDAENNTLKAEQEVAALKQQISDKVAAAKLNGIAMTADEIYKSLDMKDYTALKAMEEKKLTSKPYELTRAVNYSEDTVYGMIQAAIKAEDSDITGMTDFTASGAEYANEKYVSAEEAKDELLMKRFYEDERERYRLEQDAELTGDKSIQEKYDAMQAPKASFVPVTSQDTGAEKVKAEEKPKAEDKAPAQMPIGINRGGLVRKTEQPEEPKIDVADLESKLATVNAKLEAVDSDENAMTFEENKQLESEKEQLESQLRAYKYAHPEEYVAEKYDHYKDNANYESFVSEGRRMANESQGHEKYWDTFADPRADHSALTQSEKDMYHYLLAARGEDAANQYIFDLQTAVNARQGKKVAEAGKDDALGQVLYNASAGVVSSLQGLASNFTNEVRPTGAAEFARAELSKTNSDFQNLVNDISFSVGNMAPSILLSYLTGGIGGAALMGVSAAGNAYNEAMKSGALSTSEARIYGMMVGASEAFLGYMLGGISKLGNSTALKSLAQSISKIDNVFLRASAKIGTQMASEFTEEWLQASIEPLLQNWILGMENDINMFSEEAMYSGLLGALTASMLESAGSGMSAATEIRNERSIGKALVESDHVLDLIERSLTHTNSDVRETAKALEAGTMRWSEGNLGRLAIEYRDSGGDTGFLNQPVEANIQPAVTGVTTDRDAAMALTRAIRGQATESDLELLEKGAYIPGHEDVSKAISDAAKNLRATSKKLNAKEAQLSQLKNDMDVAKSKVDSAKNALAQHLRGANRIQQGETLPKALMVKHTIEQQIAQVYDQYGKVSEAGLEPKAQAEQLDILRRNLAEAETQVAELIAGNRESTAFQGQVANSQKSLEAANRNYTVVEAEMESLWEDYKAEQNNFRDTVSSAVNRAYADNMLAEVARSVEKARETVEVDDIPWEQNTESSDQNAPETDIVAPDTTQTDEVAEQVEETAPVEPAEATKSSEPVVTEMDYAAKRLPADIAKQVIDNHTFYTEHQGGTPEAVAMEWEENSQYAPEILNDSVPEEERAQLLAQFADAVSRANDPNYKPAETAQAVDPTDSVAYSRVVEPSKAIQESQMPVAPADNNADSNTRQTARQVSLQRSMDNAARALGVGLQKGRTNYSRPRMNRTLGYYNTWSDGINIRDGVDMRTFSHEAGHHLDGRYNLSRNHPESVRTMIENLPEEFREAYNNDTNVLAGEAIAEFVAMYVTNPAQAEGFAGTEFYNAFTEALSREDRLTLDSLRADYNDFMSAETAQKIKNTIRSYSDPTPDSATFAQKLITNIVDKYDPLRRVDAYVRERSGRGDEVLGVEGLAKNALYASQTAEELITGHFFTPDGRSMPNVDSFSEALEGLRGRDDYNTFVSYCKAKHAVDWEAQNRQVFSSDVSADERNNFIREIETNEENKRFVEAHARLMKTWHAFMKTWVVNEGFLGPNGQAVYDTMRSLNPNYVPNFRVMSNANGVQESGGMGSDGASPSASIVRRASEHGSTLDTYDPVESMIKMVQTMVATQRQNAIIRQMDTLYRTQEGMSNILMKANKEMTATNVSELIERIGQTTRDEDIADAATELLDALGSDYMVFNTNPRANGPRVINAVRRDGSIGSYEIQDQAVYDSLVGVAQYGKDVLTVAGRAARGLNALLTVKNPLFWIPNVFRDTQNLFMYGTEANPLKTVRNIGTAAYIKLRNRNDPRYQQYIAQGGGDGSGMNLKKPMSNLELKSALVHHYHDANAFREIGKWMSFAGRVLEAPGGFVEDSTRFAEFLAGLEHYGTDSRGQELAFRRSRTVTTEFAVQGKATRGLNTIFRFFSANINGNYQQMRQLTDRSTGNISSKVLRGFVYSSVMGAVAELLLHGLCGDEYDNIAEDVRMTHWCIPTSLFGDLGKAIGMQEGDYIRIPKPQGVVQGLFNLPQVLASGFMSGDLPDSVQKAFNRLLDDINPANSPITSGITDVLRNRTYYGSTIESDYLRDLPASDRYTDSTPDWAIKGARALNALGRVAANTDIVSPIQLNYIVEQYAGGVGKIVLPFVENVDDLGAGWGALLESFSQRMTTNAYYTNDIKDEFKQNKDQLNEILSSYKADGNVNMLNLNLTDAEKQQAIIELENLLSDDDQLGGINKAISNEWEAIRAIATDQQLDDKQKESRSLEHRKNIFKYQAQGNIAMEVWLDKYGPRRSITQYLRDAVALDKNDTKWKSAMQETPKALQDKADTSAMKRLQSFYQQDTSKTSFKPTYPPDFVDADNVLTAWDKVDSKTKSSMEKVWTDTYIAELNSNGFMSEKDYDTVKNLASQAKRKANAAAKEVYTIKYKFKEKD